MKKMIKADIWVLKYDINYSYSYNSLSTYLITKITTMNCYALNIPHIFKK